MDPDSIAKARDLGLAIRDFLEDREFIHYRSNMEESPYRSTVEFIDVSDANNPLVYLTNGQKFRIRIVAED